MRPSAIFFIFKEIPKFQVTLLALAAGACHNGRGGERKGRKEREGRGEGAV